MHGAFNSETAYHKKGMADTAFHNFMKLKDLLGDESPDVVVISFGPSWLLRNGDKGPIGAAHATVPNMKKIIKHIEAKHNIKGPRYLMGISMGGLNAFQMSNNFNSMFKKILFINALLTECEPFDIMDTKCWLGNTTMQSRMSIMIVKINYIFPFIWERHSPWKFKYDPLMAPMMIQVAKNDEFKFNERGKQVYTLAKSQGASVELVENSGGHESFDPEKAYEFLTGKTVPTLMEKAKKVVKSAFTIFD